MPCVAACRPYHDQGSDVVQAQSAASAQQLAAAACLTEALQGQLHRSEDALAAAKADLATAKAEAAAVRGQQHNEAGGQTTGSPSRLIGIASAPDGDLPQLALWPEVCTGCQVEGRSRCSVIMSSVCHVDDAMQGIFEAESRPSVSCHASRRTLWLGLISALATSQ